MKAVILDACALMTITEKEAALRDRIAKNLREYRLAAKKSQEELGVMAGFHRTFVSHVERSAANLTLGSISRLADALNIDPAALFRPEIKD